MGQPILAAAGFQPALKAAAGKIARPTILMSPGRNATRSALHQIIGDKYEILEWIGGGGMAEVFLARHRTHGALFAIKVLSDRLAEDPNIVARFTEEARTAATLGGHPNISEIFDIGEGAGLHYLIMPFVAGEDLSSYLQRHGRLSEPEALHIVRQITEALIWAGDRHVVHRDLKPSNIRIDLSGRAIVIDFGIAKARDVPSPLTKAGETMGTPYYMSPEQIRGETCDSRSDLYSLGVVFFELLSGRKPFTGDTLRAIEIQHIEQPVPSLGTLLSTVDPRFEQVINGLLAKDPADRYQSARELQEALQALAEGQPAVQLKAKFDRPEISQITPKVSGHQEAEQNSAFLNTFPSPTPAPPALVKTTQYKPPRTKLLIPALLGGIVLLAVVAAGFYLATRPKDKPAAKQAPPSTNLAKVLQDKNGTMFLVPAGKFIFGDDDERSPNKRQEVDLPAFYIDATEVSNGQYSRFVTAQRHADPDSENFKTNPNLPVTGVTLEDAKAFCSWAGARVPTEPEWEKAARGIDGRIYPWGNPPLPSPGKLVAVDAYPERQSPYRALNMSGNAAEWTVSEFPVTDRELDDMRKNTGRAEVSRNWCNVKGGSFLLEMDLFSRVYMRRGWPTNQASPIIGFRCVKDAN